MGCVKSFLFCLKISWKTSKYYTTIILIGKVLTPLLAMISTYLLKLVLDIVSGNQSLDMVKLQLIALIACSAIVALFSSCTHKYVVYCQSMHNEIIQCFIKQSLMKYSAQTDISNFDNPKYYDKLISINKDAQSTSQILWNVLDFISSFITLCTTLLLIISALPYYALLMLVSAIPAVISSQKYTKMLYKLELSQINEDRKKSYIYYVLTEKEFAKSIRLFNLSPILIRRFTDIWKSSFLARKDAIKNHTIRTTLLEFIPELVIAVMTLYIAFDVILENATIGDFSWYTAILTQICSSMFVLIGSISAIFENKLKIENTYSITSAKKKDVSREGVPLSQIVSIEFINVSFSYPESSKPIISDLSFKVSKGEGLAIVGINGSGKSTLVKLLLRFYDVDHGVILINSTDIRLYNVDDLRNCFSCYFQNSPNYGFTVEDNIIFGDITSMHSNTFIREALRMSGLEEDIDALPRGIKTYTTCSYNSNGIEFSGGQQQKLALARTFYRKRSVYIFDEPSSNIDPESEQIILSTINKLRSKNILIYISHSLSNIALNDKVLVLKNGHNIEYGTKLTLLKQKGLFAKFYSLQLRKYKNYFKNNN